MDRTQKQVAEEEIERAVQSGDRAFVQLVLRGRQDLIETYKLVPQLPPLSFTVEDYDYITTKCGRKKTVTRVFAKEPVRKARAEEEDAHATETDLAYPPKKRRAMRVVLSSSEDSSSSDDEDLQKRRKGTMVVVLSSSDDEDLPGEGDPADDPDSRPVREAPTRVVGKPERAGGKPERAGGCFEQPDSGDDSEEEKEARSKRHGRKFENPLAQWDLVEGTGGTPRVKFYGSKRKMRKESDLTNKEILDCRELYAEYDGFTSTTGADCCGAMLHVAMMLSLFPVGKKRDGMAYKYPRYVKELMAATEEDEGVQGFSDISEFTEVNLLRAKHIAAKIVESNWSTQKIHEVNAADCSKAVQLTHFNKLVNNYIRGFKVACEVFPTAAGVVWILGDRPKEK